MPDNTSDAQLDFLLEVLQATADSNVDQQVVYPLLKANIDKLNQTLAEKLRDWPTSKLAEAEADEAEYLAAVIGNFSILIKQFPLGDKASTMEIAITGYEVALTVFTREAFPIDWATTQNNLGEAYRNRIEGEKAQNLEDAIACYQLALEVSTREAFPIDWAMTQNNLGNAYLERIEGEKAQNLEDAIACYQLALEVSTREAFPIDWAMTKNNLGIAYAQRIEGEKAQNLEDAIACYQLALEVRTREAFPIDWASTQNNLGNAYLYRIEGEKAQNLEDAIACYQLALEVSTREAFPIDWATTQNNLGAAYAQRIEGEKAQNLEDAIACYQLALEVRTREAFPIDWASTQNNLGIAYLYRIEGEKAQNLEDAIACYQLALEVRTREAFPIDWASTQNNLGIAYLYRIEGEKAQNLEDAIACYQLALEVSTREAFPIDWATTQNNLGIAYAQRIEGEKAQNLEVAIACYQLALEVSTREAFPIDWASTQNNLGIAYLYRIEGEKAQNLEDAIACYQLALEVSTREAFPIDWAMTQNNLGEAYAQRIEGEKAQNLEVAIACYQLALEVSTRESFPRDYLDTNNNLGLAYQDAQNFPEAYKAFDAAIETVEFLRDEIISGSGVEDYKTKLAEKYNRSYLGMVEVCLELNNITAAIEYVERSKTQNLVDKILSRDLKTIFHPEVVTKLEQYRDEIAAGQYEIQQGNADNPKVLAQHLQQLRKQRNDLQYQYLPIGSRFKFKQFKNNLDDHTAIVEFYITGDKLLTFIFTGQTQQPIVWQSEPQDLDKFVNWKDEYLRDYKADKINKNNWQNDLSNRLHELADILSIDDIIEQITERCDRLILIPHRYLHLLPLHALPITSKQGEATSQILMEQFPAGVSYAPSCQLLQLAQTRKRPNFTHLFAVQNPSADLVYTNLEVEVIKGYFNSPPDTEVLVENAATKAAIDSKVFNTFHVVHFSCHGYFNYQEPRKSALILANAQKPASAEPNSERYLRISEEEVFDLEQCLTIDEVFELQLEQCRLVTLSACETGLIDFNNTSDEYIGLPSGFLVAGSPAVVSSLWRVEDLSTALLMIKFYQNLREPMSLALALNQSQLWLRDATVQDLLDWAKQLTQELKLDNNFNKKIKKVLRFFNREEKPFYYPYYWAAYCAIGQ
ncbi:MULTISPECIES: CHAT domain-containing protein [unclassified Moorena]|uniref:CHAT domain-containing protein n=1 Tax=unclassified Moorena TaxID=2683338 RepID=UPI0025E26E16|nr:MULTISPECIES: CHAT domain-containing protein [unclassified Moorena]